MEGNPIGIDINDYIFLGINMFRRFVEFSFLKNIPFSLTLAQNVLN